MVTHTFLATLLYLFYLFVPGYLVVESLGLRNNRFLLSYGISFSFLILTLAPFLWYGGTLTYWLWTLHGVILLVPLICLIRRRTLPIISNPFNNNDSLGYLLGFFVIVVIFSLYHVVVGPYTEIPSDFWEHLARVMSVRDIINDNQLSSNTGPFTQILFRSDLVHFLHAIAGNVLDTNPLTLTTGATLATSLLFLGSVYWFCLRLLENFEISLPAKVCAGILAVCLTVLTFGTATFSYVRYYAYFPTIFCFPVVYLCIVLLVDYLENPNHSLNKIYPIPIFLTVIGLVHKQEVLFTVILLSSILFWRTIRTYKTQSDIRAILYRRHRICSGLLLTGLVVLTILSLHFFDMREWGYTPHVIALPQWVPLFGNLPIANPFFRFWDTLGYFGVFVYVCYVWNWKIFQNSDYINIGMLSPLLTHFNPLFAVLFLHFGSSTGLWRTSYLMPIAIVCSIIIVTTCLRVLRNRSQFQKLSLLAMCIFFIGAISPIQLSEQFNRTSRLPSLLSVKNDSGHEIWADLIRKISQLKKEQHIRGILTDHVTKFILDSAVFGQIPFRDDPAYFPKYNNRYQNDFKASDFTHHLLIINRRNGKQTHAAKFSGHWRANILQVSTLYPDDINSFIENNQKHFKLLWHQNSISVYQIYSFHNKSEPISAKNS